MLDPVSPLEGPGAHVPYEATGTTGVCCIGDNAWQVGALSRTYRVLTSHCGWASGRGAPFSDGFGKMPGDELNQRSSSFGKVLLGNIENNNNQFQ